MARQGSLNDQRSSLTEEKKVAQHASEDGTCGLWSISLSFVSKKKEISCLLKLYFSCFAFQAQVDKNN